jgi:hypothetical protein
MVHAAAMSQSGLHSFADEVWEDLADETARRIPRNGKHSIVWIIWHLARIEDVTMNLLVSGDPQLLHRENWLVRLQVTLQHTGNEMESAEVADLSAAVDLKALRAYRLAVGSRTREIVSGLGPVQMRQKVDPARLERVVAEGAVVEAARGIVDYWGRRKTSGLLLMPPTRHNFLHLNEAARIKKRVAAQKPRRG